MRANRQAGHVPVRTRRGLLAGFVAIVVSLALSPVAGAPAQAAPAQVAVTPTTASAGAAAAPARYERWATMARTSYGYYYDAGQQDTHLVITRAAGGLRFTDTHTDVLRTRPDACRRLRSQVGLVMFCRVPATVSARNPMTIRVFTRLGDDYIDSSRLSSAFKLYGLADWGNDIVHGGAGNDFINGARGRDRAVGGTGNDWIRMGKGNDRMWGGTVNDKLVGQTGRDMVYGAEGNDRVGGGGDNDRLFAGVGKDFVLCGTGTDNVHAQRADRLMADCETVYYD